MRVGAGEGLRSFSLREWKVREQWSNGSCALKGSYTCNEDEVGVVTGTSGSPVFIWF